VSDIVRIEDLLDLLSNGGVLLRDVSQEICDGLDAYSMRLQQLKEEMDYYSETITYLQNAGERVASVCVIDRDCCAVCDRSVLDRINYVYPCHHVCHLECLMRSCLVNSHEEERKEVMEVRKT
jgi:vacuolar protein sorting-associated protein 18